jgi:Glycosyl transferase family 2
VIQALKRRFGTARRLDAVNARLDTLEGRLGALADKTGEVNDAVARGESHTIERLERMVQMLHVIHDGERDNRRRLGELRASDEYELAFTEGDPLVSILIPTYTNFRALKEAAIPSALGQTHPNVEVIVVGDCAPPETGRVIAEIGDERVKYLNLPTRGPYPEKQPDQWLASGVAPFNAALQLAKGRWVAPFADDDVLRPDAMATMVASVQRERYELCYGVLRMHHEDGSQTDLGDHPPALHGFGVQGGIFHAGLRFIGQELSDFLFATPNDWGMVRRLWRAGARIGFVNQVVCDYYPSYAGRSEDTGR